MINKLREYYDKGITRSYDFRISALEKLENSILKHYQELMAAFKKDYNKSEFDVVNTELLFVLKEIRYFKKHLHKFMAPKRVRTSLINYPSKGYILNEPYGVVFIASPWNYPFQLSFMPLVGAIASGNVVYLKVSDQTPSVKEVISKILSVFPNDYICLASDSNEERERIFSYRYDYIFYTGSSRIATRLMEKQAKYLTPMTLELGGKSPCLVDEEANLDIACKRIAWGKFLNAGQTCVAPDYILVHASIKEEFIKKVSEYVTKYYYENNKLSTNFVSVISQKHINRLVSLLENENVVFGGKIKNDTLEPTIVDNVTFESKLMEEEIFGPIMPIITYYNLDEILDKLATLDKPLAFYCFSKNKKKTKTIMDKVSYGGGCVNDVIMHLSEESLPFGGVGKSGMNSYHGKKSYQLFTHDKSVLSKHHALELNLKYPPYTDKKLNFIKKIL